MAFIDTHVHMDHRKFNSNRTEIIQAVKNSDIEILVNPASEYETNFTMRQMLEGYDWIYYGVGIHPNRLGDDETVDEEWEKGLLQLATKEKVVAIGETGLDLYRISKDESGQPDEKGITSLSRQYKWFRKQVKLAALVNLPLILHVRDAHKEAIRVLKEYQDDLMLEIKGVVHCFTGTDYEDAVNYIDMGYMLGIGGAVTYSESSELQDIVKRVPLESIVLETDSPYVIPKGIPGKRNTPLNIPYIAKVVADLKGIDIKKVERETTMNAKRLYGI